MIKISKEDVIKMQATLIYDFGGMPGIRDENLLDSALNSPFQTFDRNDLCPEVNEKAARLCYGIISNHPFQDGNKRIGILTMLVFLHINEVDIEVKDKELIELGFSIASGESHINEIYKWIEMHIL